MSDRSGVVLFVCAAALLGCGADPSAEVAASAPDEQPSATTDRAAPPRLLAPVATATLTSRGALLRWESSPGEERARVEVCGDRACRSVEARVMASHGSARVPLELSRGVHFWRVFAARGEIPSATWSFRLGPRDAPVAASHGHAADYNGDGYADLAIPASEVGGAADRVFVYLGSREGLHARPDRQLAGPQGFAGALSWGATTFDLDAGDLNGDGYSEVVVRARAAPSTPARLFVYDGGPQGPAASPTRALDAASTPGFEHGFSFGAAGDLDGDGYGDLAAGDVGVAERFDDNAGFAYLYRGGARGVAASPDVTRAEELREELFGWALAAGGDFDADGFTDLVVTAPQRSSGLGTLRVFAGRGAGFALDGMVTVRNPDPRECSKVGDQAVMAGDFDGDGYSDVVVSQVGEGPSGRRLLAYRGGPAGLATDVARSVTSAPGEAGFARGFAGGGDVNGDGYSDLAVTTDAGAVQVFLGSPAGYGATAAITVAVLDEPSGGFWSVSIAHDFDRDGYSDLYARGRVFAGSAAGLAARPPVVLAGP